MATNAFKCVNVCVCVCVCVCVSDMQLSGSFFTTVDDMIFDFNTDRTGGNTARYSGHHGVRFARTADCIMKNIVFTKVFMHEITYDHMAGGWLHVTHTHTHAHMHAFVLS